MTKHFDNKTAYKAMRSDFNRKRRDARRAPEHGFPILTPFQTRAEVEQYLSEDRLTCLMCGRTYIKLGNHVAVHDMTVQEYQDFYQLPRTIGLAGKACREKSGELAIASQAAGKMNKTVPAEYLGASKNKGKPKPLYARTENAEKCKKMRVQRGGECSYSKLTEDTVRKIKSDTLHTMKELSEIHGTSCNNIQSILAGKTWKHVVVDVKRPRYVVSNSAKV